MIKKHKGLLKFFVFSFAKIKNKVYLHPQVTWWL